MTTRAPLSPDRYQLVRALFDQAIDAEPRARDDVLQQACGTDAALREEVESLIRAHDRASEGWARPAVEHLSSREAESLLAAEPLTPGSRLGAWVVTRKIGEGGMGAVFEANRADDSYQGRVAIKTLGRGLTSGALARRFIQERQILARLQHRNIAALHDGGTTERGVPYLVMEFVDGVRIDHYCEQNRLSIRARLQLIRQVCSAVQYAHQHLVVHRDLKPGNVLVDREGTVKLLDFGIAKLLDPLSTEEGLTETGMLPMTASHASPEQLRGEPVNTSTDIFSLGVVLYQLAAGQAPFHHGSPSPLEIRRRILEESPLPPSQAVSPEGPAIERLPRTATGELDQIVFMALRKEPERRYASAEQLSGDLLRLLSGLPVQAQPDSFGYRVRKFTTRNRAAVASLSVIFLTLLVGLAVSLWQVQTVQRERGKAETVSEFLERLLLASSPDVTVGDKGRASRTVSDVLDDASSRLETEDLSTHPDVKATLQRIIGSSYLSQGQYERAEKNLRGALAAQIAMYGDDSPETLETLVPLAQLALSKADYPTAEAIYQRRLGILRQEQRRGRIAPEVLLGALSDFAVLRRARGESKEAEGLLRETLALGADTRTKVGQAESILALTLLDQGKFGEAETYARSLVSRFRLLPNADAPELCSSLTILGSVLMEKGDLVDADRNLREAEARYRRLYDSSFVATYDNIRLQAQVQYSMGRLAEAEALIDRTLEKYRQYVLPQYISYATALTIKGLILNKSGRSLEAESILRDAFRLRVENLPPGHFMSALTQGALGEVLVTRRRFEEAEQLLLKSYQSLRQSQTMDNQRIGLARGRLVALYEAWKRPGEGARLK